MRIKHSVPSHRRKKRVLERAKGFWGDRSRRYRRAVETLRRGGVFAYRDRKTKKRLFRALWITRINAALRMRGLTYGVFIHQLKQKGIIFSRDILAKIAAEHPQIFDKIIE